MEFLLVPSEEKVLPDRYPAHEECVGRMAKDETFAFQLAFLGGDDRKLIPSRRRAKSTILSPVARRILSPAPIPASAILTNGTFRTSPSSAPMS